MKQPLSLWVVFTDDNRRFYQRMVPETSGVFYPRLPVLLILLVAPKRSMDKTFLADCSYINHTRRFSSAVFSSPHRATSQHSSYPVFLTLSHRKLLLSLTGSCSGRFSPQGQTTSNLDKQHRLENVTGQICHMLHMLFIIYSMY